MSWASRRRFLVLLILGAVLAAFLSVVVIATVYETPSCSDALQNQDETGIDCGGSCAYLCTNQVQPPTVLFTKALSNGAGRMDLIASVENKNMTAAAKGVPYRVRLYGAGQVLLKELEGRLDLPPAGKATVFLPGLGVGQQVITNAFLEIDPAAPRWFTLASDPRVLPTVSNTRLGGTTALPRVEAVLSNSTLTPLNNVPVVVLIRDIAGSYIGVSSTIVPAIPPQGGAIAQFTWNGPFAGTPTAIEIIPVVPLPANVGPS